MKHTPEPWKITIDQFANINIHSAHKELSAKTVRIQILLEIKDFDKEGTLSRIVECVNACYGMGHPEQTIKDIMSLLIGCGVFMQQHPEGFALAEKIATLCEDIDERKLNHEKTDNT